MGMHPKYYYKPGSHYAAKRLQYYMHYRNMPRSVDRLSKRKIRQRIRNWIARIRALREPWEDYLARMNPPRLEWHETSNKEHL